VPAALLVAAIAIASIPAGRAVAADPVEIDTLLSLTGAAAFIGLKEQQTLSVLEKTVNASGGINGRPVKFAIHDDTSSPQNVVEQLNALIAKKAPVVLGPGIVALCMPILPLIEKFGPVTYCLSTPVQPPNGSFMVTASTSTREYIPLTMRYFRARGWTRIAMLTTTDASGQTYDRDFDALLASPEGRGLQLIAREHYNPTDVSVMAQLAKIKAQQPQVLVNFSVGPAFGTFLRQAFDAGITVPLVGSSANLSVAQLDGYKSFAPKELYFISSSGGAPDPSAPRAVRAVRDRFYRAFQEAGINAEYLHTIAWDPAMLLIEALRKYGPEAKPEQIREYLLNLRGWTGIAGVYDFRTNPQRGLGPENNSVYRWDAGKSEVTIMPMPK
jgi:branched-chain amino acid transport system substrate-binding protein